MGNEVEDRKAHFGKKEGWTYPSKSFGPEDRRLRIVTQVIETEKGLRSAVVQNEVVLRVTPQERYEIKATLVETDRSVQVLTIQKYNTKGGPSDKYHFSFLPHEVDKLVNFLVGLQSINFDSPQKTRISPESLRKLIANREDAVRLFEAGPEILAEIVQDRFVEYDLIAVAYRRKQLRYFEKLLAEPEFFTSERINLNLRPEDFWQKFFSKNTWIFGYGLCYQFLTPLDGRDPEQVVSGASIADYGKRTDGLLKTRSQINSLCYVEIKRHDDDLLGKEYRSGAWTPSSAVTGGVAQLQATVLAAARNFSEKLEPTDTQGNPTGELLFNVEPRSFLIVGMLREFKTHSGINEAKFRSFEAYRRNTKRPDIITYDELLERARFIVGEAPS